VGTSLKIDDRVFDQAVSDVLPVVAKMLEQTQLASQFRDFDPRRLAAEKFAHELYREVEFRAARDDLDVQDVLAMAQRKLRHGNRIDLAIAAGQADNQWASQFLPVFAAIMLCVGALVSIL
jgi:hypothetical protein